MKQDILFFPFHGWSELFYFIKMVTRWLTGISAWDLALTLDLLLLHDETAIPSIQGPVLRVDTVPQPTGLTRIITAVEELYGSQGTQEGRLKVNIEIHAAIHSTSESKGIILMN